MLEQIGLALRRLVCAQGYDYVDALSLHVNTSLLGIGCYFWRVFWIDGGQSSILASLGVFTCSSALQYSDSGDARGMLLCLETSHYYGGIAHAHATMD